MAPAVASRREYLRAQLPEIYVLGRDPVAPRLLQALEEVLDPIVAVLDSLPSYFDPRLAPSGALELLATWLGVAFEEDWPVDRRRATIAGAARVAALRGTRAGLEAALRDAFPSLPLRVDDSGGTRWRADELGGSPPEPAVTVHCDTPLEPSVERALQRFVDGHAPAGVRTRVEVLPLRLDEEPT
jgi:phage tail-like protein